MLLGKVLRERVSLGIPVGLKSSTHGLKETQSSPRLRTQRPAGPPARTQGGRHSSTCGSPSPEPEPQPEQ